ncbi:MAG TPA: FGGY-family carbohydrate kinase [Polyangiaceae bacterium]|nr:FGGY-family carbohydrate kinase [Polyangiaceae bacterium]
MSADDAPVVLAVDLGTSGMKVALVTLRGEVLGLESQGIGLELTADGGAEQSPEEWWQAFLAVSTRLLGRNLVPRKAVKAVCCSTQGEGTVPVDRDGNALMNCILWMDMRGAPYLNRRNRGLINVAGADVFKLIRWIRLTGGMPSPTGKDPAGHMLLVRERFPEVYARTYKFLNVLDYLNLRLTGRFAATFDSILTSWVTDNRNPDSIRYSDALIQMSGIEADKFPEIVSCTTVLGPLKKDVAEALGLAAGVQVVAGSIDNTAAAIGSGAVEDFLPHLYVGTSSWVAAHVPFKKTDPSSALASVPCAMPRRYLLTALQATAGGNLTFLKDNLLCRKDELSPADEVENCFQVMDQMAARVPAGANGIIYTPWPWGERAPVDDRNLRAGLYNLSLHNTRADVIRAFLEGVALNTRWLMKPVEKFLGRPVRKIHLAGGGAGSDVWCQIFADVLGVEVLQVKDPIQANARGAALIAAAGLGDISLSDVHELVAIKRAYVPSPEHRALYDDRFQTFVAIYGQMRGVYKKLNGRLSSASI